MTTAATLETLVHRFRRRARGIVFVRHLLMTSAAVAIALAAWKVAAPMTSQPPTLLAIGVALALAAAAIATYVCTPSRFATGAMIDRKLQLQDRVVAALELTDDRSPVAALVLRGAVERLRPASPGDVFPFEFDRRVTAATLAISLALFTVVADVGRGSPSNAPRAIVSGAPAGSPAASSVPRAQETAAPPPANPQIRTTTTASNDTSTRPQVDRAQQGATDAPALDRSMRSDEPAAPTNKRPEAAGASAESAARVDATPQSSPMTGAISGSSAKTQAGASLSGVSTGAMAGGAPTGAGGSQSASADKGTRAGGVTAGTLAPNARVTPGPSSLQMRSSLTTAARAQADAALTRDDIPPPLRRYVRDYFLRLQSGGGQR